MKEHHNNAELEKLIPLVMFRNKLFAYKENITMELFKCTQCGKEFSGKARNDRVNRFCSKKCGYKSKLRSNIIELHPNHAEVIISSKTYGVIKVLIDSNDVELVKNYNWHCIPEKRTKNDFRAVTNIKYGDKRSLLAMHRLIMDCPGDMVIDHINHDTLDNRKENLRICTHIGNLQNLKNNKSGHTGIYRHANGKKWCAQIRHKYKTHYLGIFEDIEDAIIIREKAVLDFFGEIKYQYI